MTKKRKRPAVYVDGELITVCPGCAFQPIKQSWLSFKCPCGKAVCIVCEQGCQCPDAGEFREAAA